MIKKLAILYMMYKALVPGDIFAEQSKNIKPELTNVPMEEVVYSSKYGHLFAGHLPSPKDFTFPEGSDARYELKNPIDKNWLINPWSSSDSLNSYLNKEFKVVIPEIGKIVTPEAKLESIFKFYDGELGKTDSTILEQKERITKDSTNHQKEITKLKDIKNDKSFNLGWSPVQKGDYAQAFNLDLNVPLTKHLGVYGGINYMPKPNSSTLTETLNQYVENHPNQFDANPDDGTFGAYDETRASQTTKITEEDINPLAVSVGGLLELGNWDFKVGATIQQPRKSIDATDVTTSTFNYDNGDVTELSTKYNYPQEDSKKFKAYLETALNYKNLGAHWKGIGSKNQQVGVSYKHDF